MAEYLDSPEAVAAYLSGAFETGDDSLIARALGAVARVKGMKAVAEETGLNRENLYRSLSEGGRPELGTAMKVLDALDVQLVAKPKDENKRLPSSAFLEARNGADAISRVAVARITAADVKALADALLVEAENLHSKIRRFWAT